MQRHLSQTNTAVQPSGTTLSLCTETQSRAGRAFKDPHSYIYKPETNFWTIMLTKSDQLHTFWLWQRIYTRMYACRLLYVYLQCERKKRNSRIIENTLSTGRLAKKAAFCLFPQNIFCPSKETLFGFFSPTETVWAYVRGCTVLYITVLYCAVLYCTVM